MATHPATWLLKAVPPPLNGMITTARASTESACKTVPDRYTQQEALLQKMSEQQIVAPKRTLADDLAASYRTNARMEELIGRIVHLRNARNASRFISPQPVRSFHTQRPGLGLRCPQCNKRALRKAKRKTLVETLAVMFLFTPYRCRYCRYYEMRSMLEDALPKPAPAARSRRR